MTDLNTKVALERARNVNQLGGCGRIAGQLAVDYLELHKEYEHVKANHADVVRRKQSTQKRLDTLHALAVKGAKLVRAHTAGGGSYTKTGCTYCQEFVDSPEVQALLSAEKK